MGLTNEDKAELETKDLAYNYILAEAFLKRKQVVLAQWLAIIIVSGRIKCNGYSLLIFSQKHSRLNYISLKPNTNKKI